MSFILNHLTSNEGNQVGCNQPSDFPLPPPLQNVEPTRFTSQGKKYISFSLNDRLGLTGDLRVRQAAAEACETYGVGLGSPFLGGRLMLHDELESELANFLGYQACVTFNSGYLANLGVIPAIAQAGTALLIDRFAHACIQDAYHLSRADFKRRFRHNDPSSLDHLLSNAPRARLVCVDGVYSMSGTMCPIEEILTVCQRHDAALFVDDAHGLCSVGSLGQGSCQLAGVQGRVPLLMGTFNKGLASLGGFVVGSRAVIDYLRGAARSYRFTAALTPPQAAAALKALRIVRSEPSRHARLAENIRRLRDGLRALGINVPDSPAPIVPVYFSSLADAEVCTGRLREEGVIVYHVGYPAVPRGVHMLRLAACSEHSHVDIDYLLASLQRCMQTGINLTGQSAAWNSAD